MFKWDTFGVEVNNDFVNNNEEVLKEYFSVTRNNYVLYPTMDKSKHVFCDDDNFIRHNDFTDFLDFYGNKESVNNNIIIIKLEKNRLNSFEKQIVEYQEFLKEISKYTVIENKQEFLLLSPWIFESIVVDEKLNKYVTELTSLLHFADKITYNQESILLEFRSLDKEKFELELQWLDFEVFGETTSFFSLLKWCKDNNSALDLHLKKTLIRKELENYLVEKNTLKRISFDSEEMIRRLDLALDLLISNRSEEYFKIYSSHKEDEMRVFLKRDELNENTNKSLISMTAIILSSFVIETIVNSTEEIIINYNVIKILYILFVVLFVLVVVVHMMNLLRLNKFIKKINDINHKNFGSNYLSIKNEVDNIQIKMLIGFSILVFFIGILIFK